CANVGSLQMVQAAGRTRELAVRAALGAGRWRIIRDLLEEAVLLSLFGGVLGIGLSQAGIKLFIALCPPWFPRVGEIRLDAHTLCFTVALSITTALVFGTLPAAQSSRPDLIEVFKDNTRGAPGLRRHRLRAGLVVLEISIAMVLLIGAGLMVNS